MKQINEKLEELTSEILAQNDLYKIPADILVIAQNNNINVYKVSLDEKILGAIRYIKEEDRFQILLNKKEDLIKQRYTLAHELGHFFLHQDILKSEEIHIDIMYRITDENEKEVEYFAGALLMNKLLLEKTYETIKDIKELAKLFEVSESDMTLRLSVLGLI